MARFLQLSKVLINVDAIRFVYPGMVKPQEGESFGCTVYFINAAEPYAFYGEDARKILDFVKEHPAIADTRQPA